MMDFNFAHYYKPIQGENLWPVEIRNSLDYNEYLPSRELQPYVACFWSVTVKKPLLKPVVDRIIPDGCMDIVFNLEELARGKAGSVVGIMSEPDVKEVKGIRNFVGVRFWPGGAIPFLRYKALDFADDTVALDCIWGKESGEISEQIYLEDSPQKRIEILEKRLLEALKRLVVPGENTYLIKLALASIFKNRGVISVNQLARELDISQRHLARKFKEWIGTGPKKFCSIVRFQNVIYELNHQPERLNKMDWIDLALENGYYDQAHFIRDFKKLYGKTPGDLSL